MVLISQDSDKQKFRKTDGSILEYRRISPRLSVLTSLPPKPRDFKTLVVTQPIIEINTNFDEMMSQDLRSQLANQS